MGRWNRETGAIETSKAAAALEFAARCAGDGTLPDLIAEFQPIVALFGFTASACAAWVGSNGNRASRFYFMDWPRDWQDFYLSRDWLAQDFVVAEAARRMSPFCWQDIRGERELTAPEAEFHDAARQYGWADRFAVPIHGPAGYLALVTMMSKQVCALSLEDKAALQIVALAIHERCRAEKTVAGPLDKPVALTKREVECLRWVAAGKTDWEIAQVLGLAAATVHFHVERAKKKLNTKTRAQAVALAVLDGRI